MFRRIVAVAAVTLTIPFGVLASEDPAEVAAVVAAIKAAHPNLRSLCQGGPDATRKAAADATTSQVVAGKIKGNAQAVGGETGRAVGRECRG